MEIANAVSDKAGQVTVNRHHAAQPEQSVLDAMINSLASDTNKNPTLIVLAHGEVKDGRHHMNVDGEYMPTRDFFKKIAVTTKQPVDLFSTSCYGGAAIDECKELPPGSSVVFLTTGKEVVNHADVERLVQKLKE